MTTRLSKIARLPAKTREELNRRLHDGELSRTILPWVNNLPKTQAVMAELFNGKPITHQNLSEWRHTGYQDWLFHQQRIDWFNRLEEQTDDIQKFDRRCDGYETMGAFFLFEIGQALNALQTIKNPRERCAELQNLTREFARLQNAYNWSRRVCLEWEKHYPPSQNPHRKTENAENDDCVPRTSEAENPRASVMDCGSPLPLSATNAETPELCPNSDLRSSNSNLNCSTPKLLNSQTPSQDTPHNSETAQPRVSVPDCGSPLPLSASKSQLPEPSPTSELPTPISDLRVPTSELNPSTPTRFQPLPTLAPPIPTRSLKGLHPPMRRRRFVCIEG
jgi:hypothetical protein